MSEELPRKPSFHFVVTVLQQNPGRPAVLDSYIRYHLPQLQFPILVSAMEFKTLEDRGADAPSAPQTHHGRPATASFWPSWKQSGRLGQGSSCAVHMILHAEGG